MGNFKGKSSESNSRNPAGRMDAPGNDGGISEQNLRDALKDEVSQTIDLFFNSLESPAFGRSVIPLNRTEIRSDLITTSDMADGRAPIKRGEIDWLSRIEKVYAERRIRDRVFNSPRLFGEPVWDMLLDLAIAKFKGKRLSVTSVCIGSCVPSTTALRWVGAMVDMGWAEREDDEVDARRSFLSLSKSGTDLIKKYLTECERRWPN